MGLAVAPEISLRTLSAEIAPVGNHFTQFPVAPLSLAEALLRRVIFFTGWRTLFGERRGLGYGRVWERKEVRFGGIRVLGQVGFGGNVTVGKVRCVQFIGEGLIGKKKAERFLYKVSAIGCRPNWAGLDRS
jgi:hypothetical protein